MSRAATKENKKAVACETAEPRAPARIAASLPKATVADEVRSRTSHQHKEGGRVYRAVTAKVLIPCYLSYICVIGSEGEQYCSLLAPQSIRQAQVGAGRTMIERTEERVGGELATLA
jgi:hypothetical protein